MKERPSGWIPVPRHIGRSMGLCLELQVVEGHALALCPACDIVRESFKRIADVRKEATNEFRQFPRVRRRIN